ncbi:methyl-accepting chemotaxis protein [Massilia horti]|uniref:HAMP domain-containing protein n=1 Tax=Massilia horti TaxID=2562153 RepID=A0A4Y9SWD7_9BURK|nr:methyl-accepting chemotaxis protein [Massilia horti]TFW31118.1 HAMP domain-containing protein [Massilia horti]
MWLANLRIGNRLALGFGIICALLMLIVGLAITMLGRIDQGTQEIAHNRMPRIETSNKLLHEINKVAIAVRNIMLTDDAADKQAQREMIASSHRAAKELLDNLDRTLQSAKGRQILEEVKRYNDVYLQGIDQLVRMIDSGDKAGAETYLAKQLRPQLAALQGAVNEQIGVQTELAEQAAATAAETFTSTRNLMFGLGLAILAFAASVSVWITRSITGPVRTALDVANTVAKGDLTSRIEVHTRDEMGQLLEALETMNQSLARTVSTVRTGTDAIATASGQMAAGSQDLSARTEQQASSLEETASSIEELSSTVKQNADNARQANTLAMSASNVAAKGGQVIDQVVTTMVEINNASGKITDIIGVIDGIAFQTNILALNAAVEAARAGEQGRGFAVVASEVRNLAQRSAAAAKEIKTLIDNSTAKVESGSKLVSEAGTTMSAIVDSVRRVTDIMSEISAASQEQTAGIEQISQAITQMDDVTQQNAALVEESAAAAQAMQDQATTLAAAVSVFRLDASVAAAPVAQATHAVPARAALPVHAPRAKQAQHAKPVPRKEPATTDDWQEF